MKMGRAELQELREELERLTDFIRGMEGDRLPYFYHCFDTMKNNIEIYFYVGSEDTDDLFLSLKETRLRRIGCLSECRIMTSGRSIRVRIRIVPLFCASPGRRRQAF